MTDARERTGVHIALFGTALMWGLNVSAVKALTQYVDVMLVASLRTVLATLALTLLVSTELRCLGRDGPFARLPGVWSARP